jgi:hypothetical protein
MTFFRLEAVNSSKLSFIALLLKTIGNIAHNLNSFKLIICVMSQMFNGLVFLHSNTNGVVRLNFLVKSKSNIYVLISFMPVEGCRKKEILSLLGKAMSIFGELPKDMVLQC